MDRSKSFSIMDRSKSFSIMDRSKSFPSMDRSKSKAWQLYGKTIAANPRMSIFEKCLKSCFDRLER